MLYRQKRTREKIAEDLKKDRERKRALSKKGDDGDIRKFFDEREENRKRMEKIRSNLSQQETAIEKQRLRERMAKLRLKQSSEEREYDKIRKKIESGETLVGFNTYYICRQTQETIDKLILSKRCRCCGD